MKEALKCVQDRGDTVASAEVSSDGGADLTRLLLLLPQIFHVVADSFV